jgi:hypothetical protein
MPCDSGYLNATNIEIEMSKVACLLDELDGTPIDKSYWRGYHPRVYGRLFDADRLVATLCSRLQGVDVTKHSLEMQMWWRDHLAADKARVEAEIAKVADEEARKLALMKLTKHERILLGLEEEEWR